MKNSPCFILKLPQELRDMIYVHVLQSHAPGNAIWLANDREDETEEHTLPGIALLAVNKQIRQEAMLVLARINVFNLSFHLRHMRTPKLPRQYHKAFRLFRRFRIYVQICYYEVGTVGRSRTNVKTLCAALASHIGKIHAKQFPKGGPPIDMEILLDGDERLFPINHLALPDHRIFSHGQQISCRRSRICDQLLRGRLHFLWGQVEAVIPGIRDIFAEVAPLVSLRIHPDIDNLPPGVGVLYLNDYEVAFRDQHRGEMGILCLNRKWASKVAWHTDLSINMRSYDAGMKLVELE